MKSGRIGRAAAVLTALSLLMMGFCGCSEQTQEPSSAPPVSQNSGGTTMTDEEFLALGGGVKPRSTSGRFLYKTAGEVKLYFYLTQPTSQKYEKAPLLINFVGPGWTAMEVKSPISYMANYYGTLLNDGFANLTVSYRGSENGGSMSELLADLMDALSYISRYNTLFGIDMEHIVLLGQSAGAHVGLMLLLAPEELLTADCVYPAFSHNFLGCMAINAPTILYPDEETGQLLGTAIPLQTPLFGGVSCYDDDTQQRRYSPLTYVRADMKPVLLGVGTSDQAVNPKQSYLFEAAAKKVGGDCTMLVLEHAGHGFEAVDGEITPPVSEFYQAAYAFIHRLIQS